MPRGTNTAAPKETIATTIKTVIAVAAFSITLTTTVFLGGSRIGKTESAVVAIKSDVIRVEEKVNKQDDIIRRMDKEVGIMGNNIKTLLDIVKRWENTNGRSQ